MQLEKHRKSLDLSRGPFASTIYCDMNMNDNVGFVCYEESLSMSKKQQNKEGSFVRKQLGSIVPTVSQSAPPFFWETSGPELHELAIQIKYVTHGVPLLEFFLCFSSCIFSGAVSCSCIPVANSSCKFYLHWGKHSQAQKKVNKVQVD